MTTPARVQPNPPRAQHYLPRFYLRGFGQDDEVLVRRRNGQTFPTGTAVVGHENFMYEHPELPGGSVETEYLKELDARASETLVSIRTHGVPNKLSTARSVFARFLAVQHTRTPERREQLSWRTLLREYAGDRELTRNLVRDLPP